MKLSEFDGLTGYLVLFLFETNFYFIWNWFCYVICSYVILYVIIIHGTSLYRL